MGLAWGWLGAGLGLGGRPIGAIYLLVCFNFRSLPRRKKCKLLPTEPSGGIALPGPPSTPPLWLWSPHPARISAAISRQTSFVISFFCTLDSFPLLRGEIYVNGHSLARPPCRALPRRPGLSGDGNVEWTQCVVIVVAVMMT